MKDKQQEMLDFCLKCSICHTQCPVVSKFPDYPGPKYIGPEAERLRLTGKEVDQDDLNEYLSYCLNCKRCDEACPHGVKPSIFNIKNRAKSKKSFKENISGWILGHNDWWGRIADKMPGISNFILKNPLIKLSMSLVGISPRRNFPQYKSKKVTISSRDSSKKAVYFRGCYARSNEPDIIQSTVKLLEYAGYKVEIAPLNCCGIPLINNGLLKEAQNIASKNITTLQEYINSGYVIVTSCPSCTMALKEEYNEIFNVPGSEEAAHNVWDVFELLQEEGINLPVLDNKYENAFYHIPCHLKAQGISYPAAEFLKSCAVNELEISDSFCCGIAGTFGFKDDKYKLSLQIGEDLFSNVNKKDYSLIITDCGTCKVQIEQGTGKEPVHPALVLAETLK